MAEDEVVAEARQSIMQLVRLLRTINGAMNNRRQTRAGVQETDQFVNRFDEQLPGMRYEMNRGEQLDDAQLADRFDSQLTPDWADHAAQTVDSIPPTHPVYSDPQADQARQAYVEQHQRYAAALQAHTQQLAYLQRQGYAQAPPPATLSAAAQRSTPAQQPSSAQAPATAQQPGDAEQRAQQAGRLGQGLMDARARVEAGRHREGEGTVSVADLQARLAAAGDPALADGLRAQAMTGTGEVQQADGTGQADGATGQVAGSNGEQELRHRRAAAPQAGTRER